MRPVLTDVVYKSVLLAFGLIAPVLSGATIPDSERAALTTLFTSTNGLGWAANINWCSGVCPASGTFAFNSAGTECTWHGVACDGTQSHITGFALPSNNLGGSLPPLADLGSLLYFNVDSNQITGSIPDLAELTGLTYFDVGNNQLTGSLPDLTALTALEDFLASNNQLTGNIPALAGLADLYEFEVDNNALTGSIPALGGLPNLTYFSVDHNQLTGAVPAAATSLAGAYASLCPNPLSATPSANDAGWDAATGYAPWWTAPFTDNRCDELFTSKFESAIYYVALDGNDAWSGQLPAPNSDATDGPFATFDQARLAVQALNKAGLVRVVVEFRAGTYFLPATEQFTAADSGTANTEIIYQNYPGESPVISAGIQVQNWTNTSGNTWTTTLPASIQYFENLYYNGVRRLRPRLGGYLGAYLRVVSPVYLNDPVNDPPPPAAAPDPNCSIYVTGSGWECFDRFYYDPLDPTPVVDTWQNLAPSSSNPCGVAAGNPAVAGDIEVIDFEKYNVSKLRIDCVDATNHIVYLTGPTGMNPTYATTEGFIAGHRYLVENIADELDEAGQWFLDRSTTPWTLTYLANPGENPNTDNVVIPQIAQILSAFNLQYVNFHGLTFAHDNYTLPATGYAEPVTTVPAAISLRNSQHVTFDADIVTNISGVGLEFISCAQKAPLVGCNSFNPSGVTSSDLIENSAFYDVAGTAIRVGLPGRSTDTAANIPQFMTVRNNVVSGYGRVFPGAKAILQGDGHDNLYTHNDVYDGYHGAIAICNCGGPYPLTSNNTLSFNHVYNLFQGIMNDGGSLYIEASAGGTERTIANGNRMLNNKVHDVSDASALDGDASGYGGDGLYVDDFTGLVEIKNNLVYRVSDSALSFSGPRAGPNQLSNVRNNIFAFARQSLINASDPYTYGIAPPAQMFDLASNNLFYFDRDASMSTPFYVQGGCTYDGGIPYTQFEQWSSNLYWRTDAGFASDTKGFHVQPNPGTTGGCANSNPSKWTFYSFAGWQSLGEDVTSVIKNPGFNNPAYPADDYSLPAGSPGVGFVVFDATQAGRSNAVIVPPAVPATFPTQSYNPATDF